MITLFSGIYDNIVMLDQFLAHYDGLGVEAFVFTVNGTFDPEMPARVAPRLAGYEARIAQVSKGPQNWVQQNRLRNAAQRTWTRAGDWAVIADLDEFQTYPRGLAATLREADAHGCDCLYGQMIDRLAPDGDLVELREQVPVFEQFPVRAHVTRDILLAPDWKIVAVRAHVLPPGTCVSDIAMREKYGAHPATDLGIEIHHFKWHAGVVERLQRRVAFYASQYASGDPRFVCYRESANFLEHLERHGRVRLDAVHQTTTTLRRD